ncbi:MAG: metallophosphoesterase family protein [Candidatus Omnitrophica bacterium]|nr:metallophosphoesterase family protein [Candidatus Omnitrophota bacterium]
MRVALLSDIHSNLEALLGVEEEIKKLSPDKVICLGDIVGYAARPNACIEIVKKNSWLAIAGNHDLGCLGKLEISSFNPYARKAIVWTQEKLSQENQSFLNGFDLTYKEANFICTHGSLFEPDKFHYLDNYSLIFRDFSVVNQIDEQICFVAHTHIPACFIWKADNLYRDYSSAIEISSKCKYIINIGSVGQPRDRDSRSCFCIFDTQKNTLKFIRLRYDIKTTQGQIIEEGLPEVLANRLSGGW